MKCIYCEGPTKVTNSRPRLDQTWRRRQCITCRAIFTTRENPDLSSSIRVNDQISSSLEPFSRVKLFLSIHDSLSHHSAREIEAEALTDTLVKKLLSLASRGLIDKSIIRQEVLKVLKHFDEAAFVYFKAHH